jgi:pyruvate carboxylase
MALFMVTGDLTVKEVLDPQRELAFPESVVDLLSGKMGLPQGGFPPEVQKRILRGGAPLTERPGATLPPADFAAAEAAVEKILGQKPTSRDVMSYFMYPKVFAEYAARQEQYGDTSVLPTPVFFYGPEPGEEFTFDIERGKTLIVKYLTMGDPHPDGRRTVFFELNGQSRNVTVQDRSLDSSAVHHPKADANDPNHVGAPMPGSVVTVAVHVGDAVAKGQKLLSMEAMKMETTVYAERDGKITELLVRPGVQVETGDLLVRFG